MTNDKKVYKHNHVDSNSELSDLDIFKAGKLESFYLYMKQFKNNI